MKMTKSKFFLKLILGMVLAAGMTLGVLIGNSKIMNYKKNGIKVKATVVQTYGKSSARVKYINQDGQKIVADATLNTVPIYGKEYIVYYLEDDPTNVLKPPGIILTIIVYVLVGIFDLVGVLSFVTIIKILIFKNIEEYLNL